MYRHTRLLAACERFEKPLYPPGSAAGHPSAERQPGFSKPPDGTRRRNRMGPEQSEEASGSEPGEPSGERDAAGPAYVELANFNPHAAAR